MVALYLRTTFAALGTGALLAATAQTGIAVPQMTGCDAQVQNLLSTYNIPGASLALTRQGKLVYDRAFGNADRAGLEPTQPYHRFRLASVSKPITGIAAMVAVQQGLFNLDDHPFGPEGLLAEHPYLGAVSYTDERLNDITLRQLLQHTAGWDREIGCFPAPTVPYAFNQPGCDPIVVPLHVMQTLGESGVVAKHHLVRFLMERGLDHAPGTTYAYSNIGYLVVGICIEMTSGMTYEEFVQQIFEPAGVCDLQVGNTLLQDKLEREVEYIGQGGSSLSFYGTGAMVPWEYGAYNINAMDAHGGWVCSARDLVKLLAVADGFTTVPDVLTNASVTAMTTVGAPGSSYALGWQVNTFNNWWHTGALDGTATMLVRSWNGYTWALLLNKRLTNAQATAFWTAVDALGWNCVSGTTTWPTHDLMSMPRQSATAVQAQVVAPGHINVQWQPGDGDGRIVVMRRADAPDRFPLDGHTYVAPNTDLGTGSDLGDGSYVVYVGDGNTTEVTSLPGGDHVVQVFEYTRNASTGQHPLYRLCGRSDAEVGMPVGIHDQVSGVDALRIWQRDGQLWVEAADAPAGSTFTVVDALGRALLQGAPLRNATALDLRDAASGLFTVLLVHQGRVLAVQRQVLVH